jgi:phage terminase large subunit-like protein
MGIKRKKIVEEKVPKKSGRPKVKPVIQKIEPGRGKFGDRYPHTNRGYAYAKAIVNNERLACKFVIGACQRFIDDVERTDADFYFEPKKSEKFLTLVQRFDHVIGKWKSSKIIFEDWQCFVWANIMGFINRSTGYRRFRIAHIEVPRGSSKSTMASQAALFFMALDESNGNQVATVATKKEQARIVLDAARAMARKNENFCRAVGVKVLAHSIVQDKTNSNIRALSSEASSLDGLNDVLAVCDELHAMKRETFDVIYSGMSKRKDSLTLCITTAGFDLESVGYSQSLYAKKIATNELQDEQFFSAVYTIDEGDDIYDPKTWEKANPNWGVSVDPITFEAKAKKTQATPSDLPNFKVKHLNIWLSEARPFYNLDAWDLCEDKTIKLEDFKNHKCYMGIDLASHIDLTCIGLVFKKDGKYFVFDKTFLPEGTIAKKRNDLYEKAIAAGDLIVTQGDAINMDFIRLQAETLARSHKVEQCMYDTWSATEMAQKLSNKIDMVKFQMNTANFSEPMKKFDAMIRTKQIVHNGSSILRWCLGNVVAKEDANGNVYPRKSHSDLKIDPIISLLMALAGHLQEPEVTSIYSTRGIRTVG